MEVTFTPDIKFYHKQTRPPALDKNQLQELKEKTFYILEKIGLKIPNQRALSVFREHGAKVEGNQVFLPQEIVEKYMAKAPKGFVLGGREERFDLDFHGNHSYLTPISTGIRWRQPNDGKIVPTCKKHLIDLCRFYDASPMVSMVRGTVTSLDFGDLAPVHDCHAMLTNSLKHARGGTVLRPDLAFYIVEMAKLVAGSSENMHSRPPINANICSISPLCHDDHGLECAMIYAENNIPVSFLSVPILGATSPLTIMGATAMGCAETVAGACLLQMIKPGAKVFLAVEICLMDPRTGRCINDTTLPVGYLTVDAIHDWNVPCLLDCRASLSASDIGWQSGVIGGLMSMVCANSGAEQVGSFGLLQDVMLACPADIVLELEAHKMAYETTMPIEEDDYALELMESVGSGGNFLAQRNTVDKFRKMNLSKVLRQIGPGGKERSPREVAIEIYQQTIKGHRPEPLPDPVLKEMDNILDKAREQA
jgi:trimethylamine---corrinoid protein Co-methyltransferase